jgi:hypothetical protein
MRGATRWVVMEWVRNGIVEIGKAWAIQVCSKVLEVLADIFWA